MTDKKLTDEEIIKRLERCVKRGNRNYDTDIVLDLINRQKAEIERLKSELSNTRRKALLEASSKFAGHSNYHGDTILCKLICMAEGQEVGIAIPLDISKIKTEAYTEFAERLKETSVLRAGCVPWYDIHAAIDYLLKEMTGE